MKNPLKEGVIDAYQLYNDTTEGPPFAQFEGKFSLTDICTTHALFTYAPLFLYGGLEHNPVQEWINIRNMPPVVKIIKLPSPVINVGPTDVSPLDFILWAAEKPHWLSLAGHIGSTALINRTTKTYTRVLCQAFPITDVLKDTQDSTVTITTFSVDSNKMALAFKPPTLTSRACLTMYKPMEETVLLGQAIFRHDPTPYSTIQALPWEQNDARPDPPSSSV